MSLIYVLKNPDPFTRAITAAAPDARPGWEQMEEADFIAWRAAQPEIVQPSSRKTVFTFTEFCDRCDALIPGFVNRIYAAALVSPEVARWKDVAVSRDAVHLDAPELSAAFAAFTAAGLMTGEEAAILISP